MKKIINYKKYDTETARVVGNWISGSKEEDNYRDETLYCKKNGEYFLDDKGGMCSDYHTAFWIDYDCEHGDWEELIEESKEKDKNGETVIVKKIVRKIVGSFKQFPIKIAWAMSIHKSQGQTFGQVNIDPRCWDSGQFYVAVSRAESVAGIHFMAPIMKQYIRTLSDEVIKILRESLYSII